MPRGPSYRMPFTALLPYVNHGLSGKITGMTQEALAHHVGVSRRQVSRWIHHGIPPADFTRVAAVFGFKPWEILSQEEYVEHYSKVEPCLAP